MNTIVCCVRCREPRREGASFCYRCGLCVRTESDQLQNQLGALGLAGQEAAQQQSNFGAMRQQQGAATPLGMPGWIAEALGVRDLLP